MNTLNPTMTQNEQRLITACENGDLTLAERMIELGVDPQVRSSHGESLLHLAVRSGNTAMIRYVLDELHLDPNVRDSFGRTPLHWATMQNNVDAVEVLLLARANINAKDDKDISVLIYAETGHSLEIIKIFRMVLNARR